MKKLKKRRVQKQDQKRSCPRTMNIQKKRMKKWRKKRMRKQRQSRLRLVNP